MTFCYFADMDQLSANQETLRKNSTELLHVMTGWTGDMDDDELETMDRVALLELMAKCMMAKKGAVQGAVGGSVVIASGKTDRAREVELQLALKKMELDAEIEKEKVKASAESENNRRQMELEAEKEREKVENERRRMELDDAKSQRSMSGVWHR